MNDDGDYDAGDVGACMTMVILMQVLLELHDDDESGGDGDGRLW